jgi:hypothetical protein
LRKHTNETTINIPENTDISAEKELKHVLQWSLLKILLVNFDKSEDFVLKASFM